eukprot:scaffold15254_cov73-Phaeocystis_antarctica.AAC.4
MAELLVGCLSLMVCGHSKRAAGQEEVKKEALAVCLSTELSIYLSRPTRDEGDEIAGRSWSWPSPLTVGLKTRTDWGVRLVVSPSDRGASRDCL